MKKRAKNSKPAKQPKGRPKTEIDVDELEKLCAMQCTDYEIAAWFKFSTKTVQRMRKDPLYADVFRTGEVKGKVSIKRAQYRAAVEQGNITMLIWLGKVMLGQKETIKNQHTGENDGEPIRHQYTVDKEAFRRARAEVLDEF